MDYRNILAFAAVIFATGYLVRSFQPANAFPQGPNVSMGSNPIESWAGRGNNWDTLTTLANNFVITDISVYWSDSGSGDCRFYLSTDTTSSSYLFEGWIREEYSYLSQIERSFASGIPVAAGQTLYAKTSNSICRYNISGYYTH